MSDTEVIKEPWVYMGLRRNSKNLVDSWLLPNGNTAYYVLTRGNTKRMIGATYMVAQTDDKQAAFDRQRVENAPLHPETANWHAAEQGAKTAQARIAAEKRLTASDPLAEHINALAQAYLKIRGHADRAGFLMYVQERICSGGVR